MRARAQLTAGRRLRIVEDPPLAFRSTPDGVYQVGTAGGPAGDDDLELQITVLHGHHLRLRSVAATVVYAGSGTSQRTTVDVGAGGSFRWDPEPVIATAGCNHDQQVAVELAADARLDLTELLVLGRHGEGPGRLSQRLAVDIAGRPLLRHELRVGPGAPGWSGPAVLGATQAVGLRLVAGPDLVPPPVGAGEGWAWCPLEGPGWLLVVAAVDLSGVRGAIAEAGSPAGPPEGAEWRVSEVSVRGTATRMEANGGTDR